MSVQIYIELQLVLYLKMTPTVPIVRKEEKRMICTQQIGRCVRRSIF